MKLVTTIICTCVVLAAWPLLAPAQPQDQPNQAQPNKEQLKSQFKAREAELRDVKKQGKVGETIDGYVDAVQPADASDQKIARLIADENKDRRSLYQILADEINKENPNAPVKATVETIASRNALRNIEHATPEEYLRVAKDHWIRIKDFPRYQKLASARSQGRIGETAAGTVEVVKPEDAADKTLQSLVNDENAARNAEYKARANTEHTDAATLAKRAGARNIDNARVGEMVKDEKGGWRKK